MTCYIAADLLTHSNSVQAQVENPRLPAEVLTLALSQDCMQLEM